MEKENKKWYQKKRYVIPAAFVVALISLSSLGGNSADQTPNQVAPVVIPAAQTATVNSAFEQKPLVQPVAKPTPKQSSQSAQKTNSGLSNDNYYTNVNGNQVHSPTYADEVPDGASARCGDGTYSFSQNRRGTCSHHGGVAQWL